MKDTTPEYLVYGWILVGSKIVDHSDVVRASPVGATPTISTFST